jgi:hypothetical protein
LPFFSPKCIDELAKPAAAVTLFFFARLSFPASWFHTVTRMRQVPQGGARRQPWTRLLFLFFRRQLGMAFFHCSVRRMLLSFPFPPSPFVNGRRLFFSQLGCFFLILKKHEKERAVGVS